MVGLTQSSTCPTLSGYVQAPIASFHPSLVPSLNLSSAHCSCGGLAKYVSLECTAEGNREGLTKVVVVVLSVTYGDQKHDSMYDG